LHCPKPKEVSFNLANFSCKRNENIVLNEEVVREEKARPKSFVVEFLLAKVDMRECVKSYNIGCWEADSLLIVSEWSGRRGVLKFLSERRLASFHNVSKLLGEISSC